DRAFMRLVLTNVAMIAVGWGVLPWIVPPYASSALGVSTRAIGLLMLANAGTVVVAQIPIVRLAEGRRRAVAMGLAGATFALACLLVASAGGFAALVAAAVVFALGECLHTSALTPLVADLAPPAARGRYMAVLGLSWWVGLASAPAL